MPAVVGYYAETHYRVCLEKNGETEELYCAGNSPWESQGYLPAEDGVGIVTMRQFCEQTAREFATERSVDFAGVYKEDSFSYEED